MSGKDTSGQRLTYLLRPNVTRPDFFDRAAIATPPATESDMSTFEAESDFADTDMRSDATSLHSNDDSDNDLEGAPPILRGNLSDIAESLPGSPMSGASQPPPPAGPRSIDGWSVVGDSDMEREDPSDRDHDLASSVDSLSLQDPMFVDRTPRTLAPGLRQTPLRATYMWDRSRRRSASSPSRSPARRGPVRHFHPRVESSVSAKPSERSFHAYLFA